MSVSSSPIPASPRTSDTTGAIRVLSPNSETESRPSHGRGPDQRAPSPAERGVGASKSSSGSSRPAASRAILVHSRAVYCSWRPQRNSSLRGSSAGSCVRSANAGCWLRWVPSSSDFTVHPSRDDRRAKRDEQRDTAISIVHRYNPAAVVVVGTPFGHTRPQWIVPYGGS